MSCALGRRLPTGTAELLPNMYILMLIVLEFVGLTLKIPLSGKSNRFDVKNTCPKAKTYHFRVFLISFAAKIKNYSRIKYYEFRKNKNGNGQLMVPDCPIIPFIEGDGIELTFGQLPKRCLMPLLKKRMMANVA